MAYPTTADLVAASSVAELTSLGGGEQDVLRDSAISAVEEFTGQVFDETQGTEVLDGSGSDVLYLPRRLERLDDVKVKGASVALTYLHLSRNGDRLNSQRNLGLGYYERTLLEFDTHYGWDGTRFALGYGTIEVTGLWGWSAPPPPVVTAIRIDMEDQALADSNALSSTIRAYRKLGLRNVHQGGLAIDLRDPTPRGSALGERVQQMLMPYVWASGGVLA